MHLSSLHIRKLCKLTARCAVDHAGRQLRVKGALQAFDTFRQTQDRGHLRCHFFHTNQLILGMYYNTPDRDPCTIVPKGPRTLILNVATVAGPAQSTRKHVRDGIFRAETVDTKRIPLAHPSSNVAADLVV